MKLTLLAAAFSILAAGTAHAQSAPQAECEATVNVSSAYEVPQGDDFTFSANLNGGPDSATPTYNWSVSAGTISEGQGTATIILSSKELEAGQTVTATVEIGGMPAACGYLSNSATVSIAAPTPKEPAKPAKQPSKTHR